MNHSYLQISPPSKKVIKNSLLFCLGVHLVCWGRTYKFSPVIAPKKNFFLSPAGDAGAPTAPLATPMHSDYRLPIGKQHLVSWRRHCQAEIVLEAIHSTNVPINSCNFYSTNDQHAQ